MPVNPAEDINMILVVSLRLYVAGAFLFERGSIVWR